ncbi:hypothetical protein PHLGIDRAFT_60974 [Phlebiopsis gigantea 11061_1 CR5-6]|uniref:Ricin B lectin domain-containing protein n=1 Tax=Phlebiopsis gigantea (strain 11061_1 CR5-6) TaxID=745531 RepID=A0A0C3SFT8_PHLG1|nr:hypothetical protein PHLGIDRAFT_60974 [Phlebiopsis gigantea 11061_1 CR5-6]
MATIEDGLYTITSKVGNANIGRFPVEDLSLLPKRILKLDADANARQWIIVRSGEGCTLKAKGAPVGENDQKLWAHLIMEEKAHPWLITPVPQMGEGLYIIEKTDRSAGWSVVDEENSQIQVKPLISTRSLPPMYPANQLFIIARHDSEY